MCLMPVWLPTPMLQLPRLPVVLESEYQKRKVLDISGLVRQFLMPATVYNRVDYPRN